ncbi:hypothetical protein GCM10022200_03550 [Microbacterium awajiense]|uniref:DUF6458 domain-containing protein n=1 Tax=Microbacterium awajiense TaxID=415214 RepID=A0ABP7A417_9MICO
MSIGAGIVLIAIGAILAFAVNVETEFVDLDMVGYILMGAGVVVLLIGIVLLARRRQVDSVARTTDSAGNEQVTHRTTSSTDDAAGL